MRGYPMDQMVYGVLVGFSQLEMLFIPNIFFNLFPESYNETSFNPIKFAWGTHNFIQHMGSIFIVYIGLQVILFVYYALKRHDPRHVSRYKLLQEFIIEFWIPVIFFNGLVSLIGLALNFILSNTLYMVSQIVAIVILLIYIGYLIGFVRKYLIYELYKINNVFRAVCLAVMCVNTYGGLVTMIVLEFIFIFLDVRFYRELKINKITYGLDRILMLAALICGCAINKFLDMMCVLGALIGVLFIIKGYYITLRVIDFIEERRKRQLTDASSDAVN